MREKWITGLLLIVAAIHLAPISGFFGVERLAVLYQIDIEGNDLEILMRHRAMLFGILGSFFAYAAFRPALQPLAFAAAFASLASFFYLAFSVGGFNDALRRVARFDIAASLALFAAISLYRFKRE